MTKENMRPADAVWIAHNYSRRVGFAWNNISRLFQSIIAVVQARGMRCVTSYATLAGGFDDEQRSEFAFDPYDLSLASLFGLYRNLKRFNVRYAYLTDQPTVSRLYVAIRLSGVKKIVVHSRESVANPYPAIAERGWRKLAKRTVSRVGWWTPDRIITVSEFVAHRLRVKACFPPRKLSCIHNGIDLLRFAPRDVPLDRDGARIFIGCRATQYKGVDVLFRACARLNASAPPVPFKVRFAGDGPDMVNLRQLAVTLGIADQVDFLGEISDVADEMHSATVVVVPSSWGDACPSAVLEALACGKPLIATRAGGIPELLEDGKSGLLVEPGSDIELAEALRTLLQSAEMRATMSREARARAQTCFDLTRYHGQVVRALEENFGFVRDELRGE